MKHPRLSAVFVAVSAASLLMVSTAGIAAHKTHHTVAKVEAEHENYKGENFKAEVPPPCPPRMVLLDGFYIGAGVGYDSYRVNHSSETTSSFAGDVDTFSFSSNQSATGWMGGIFAGYGRYFDWMYLALELNGNASGAKGSIAFGSNDGPGISLTGKARGSYGVALLPGMKLSDSSLLYVRLGYLRTNFKTNVSGVDDLGTPFSGSMSNWRNGFEYGVGIETYVAENVSIRGEFDHTQFNSKSFGGSFVRADGVLITDSASFKPSNNEFMLSLLYHFA